MLATLILAATGMLSSVLILWSSDRRRATL